MKRKICVVTGTRAEYGLLQWLMREVEGDRELQLQLIVTGMHLSPEFGYTVREIENEFSVDKKIEILLSSDTPVAISKSTALGLIGFSEAFDQLRPDLVVLLGDRFEILAAAVAASISVIPVAHIHGGEITQGAFDDQFRHSITKMSHIHFTATEEYRQRVIQLGEDPRNVYNFGGLGVDSISKVPLLSREELEKDIGIAVNRSTAIVGFHPVTLEKGTAKEQAANLLASLDSFDDLKVIFTGANADTDGRVINAMFQEYTQKNPEKAVFIPSLGQKRYFSALSYCGLMIGNSSSGLLEAPSFHLPVVNIGDRQKGRVRGVNVIDCRAEKKEISDAIVKATTPEFREYIEKIENPYGKPGASQKIAQVLKEVDLKTIIKKAFYDVNDE